MDKLLVQAKEHVKAVKNQSVLVSKSAIEIAKKIINKKNKLLTQAMTVLVLFSTLYGPMASAATAPSLNISSPSMLTAPDEVVLAKAIPADSTGTVSSSFYAIVTQYSYADSCHNVVEGKCLMASGRAVYVGAVACPRFLPLGTKVEVEGEIYRCEDRYATWVDTKRGMPTIDIFVNGTPKGNSVKEINVVK
jgi:hypothetical protein